MPATRCWRKTDGVCVFDKCVSRVLLSEFQLFVSSLSLSRGCLEYSKELSFAEQLPVLALHITNVNEISDSKTDGAPQLSREGDRDIELEMLVDAVYSNKIESKKES